MKKIYLMLFILSMCANIGCFDDSEDDSKPVLTVNYTYTGSNYNNGETVWCDIFTSASGVKNYNTSDMYGGLGLDSSTGTISDTIDPGSYYLVVYLDNDKDDYLTSNDNYEIYQDINKSGTPTPVTVSEGTTTVSVIFGDANTW